MTDKIRRIDDGLIELLQYLSMMPAESARLTDALRHCDNAADVNSPERARKALAKLARELTEVTGDTINLLQLKGKQGSFATEACKALNPGLAKIIQEREIARTQAMRASELEWLQLSSCLDQAPLRIGAYQAHAERFLASAVNLMIQYFPWVDCELDVEETRSRSDRYRGRLRDRFNSRDFDFMLVPRESEQSHLDRLYTYSFRVVGHPSQLNELRSSHNVVHVRKLCDRRIIVASEGSSSRQRLRDLLLDVGTDIEDPSFDLLMENNPNLMRIRAETGQGIAVMSDEYSAVGGSRMEFPYLARGPEKERAVTCSVDMCLLRKASAVEPRHRAFDFVIRQLIDQEAYRERAAAQA